MKKHKFEQAYIIQNNFEVRPYTKLFGFILRSSFLNKKLSKFLTRKVLINKVSIPLGECAICEKPKNVIEHE